MGREIYIKLLFLPMGGDQFDVYVEHIVVDDGEITDKYEHYMGRYESDAIDYDHDILNTYDDFESDIAQILMSPIEE